MSRFPKSWQLRYFRNLKLSFVLTLVLTPLSRVHGYVSPANNPSIMIVGDSISQAKLLRLLTLSPASILTLKAGPRRRFYVALPALGLVL